MFFDDKCVFRKTYLVNFSRMFYFPNTSGELFCFLYKLTGCLMEEAGNYYAKFCNLPFFLTQFPVEPFPLITYLYD
mgnify:CR=1